MFSLFDSREIGVSASLSRGDNLCLGFFSSRTCPVGRPTSLSQSLEDSPLRQDTEMIYPFMCLIELTYGVQYIAFRRV